MITSDFAKRAMRHIPFATTYITERQENTGDTWLLVERQYPCRKPFILVKAYEAAGQVGLVDARHYVNVEAAQVDLRAIC